jgi:histidinol phosphatase-like enzyme (inositol monophosphatase family)
MQREIEFAVAAARAAGDRALTYFQSPGLGHEIKSDGSPVTRADREAERLLRERIAREFPADGILGEEEDERTGDSGRTWILDPVDGTISFARGVPLFGTLVALEIEGRAALGVVYLPALGEMVHAATGAGAWWTRRVGTPGEVRAPARVSEVDALDGAVFSYTSCGEFERAGRARLYDALCAATRRDRGWSDCYGHVLVATGRVDVMIDPTMNVWDCAALQPIVEEAGGRFTDLAGEPTHRGGSAVSTNGALAAAVAALIEASRP